MDPPPVARLDPTPIRPLYTESPVPHAGVHLTRTLRNQQQSSAGHETTQYKPSLSRRPACALFYEPTEQHFNTVKSVLVPPCKLSNEKNCQRVTSSGVLFQECYPVRSLRSVTVFVPSCSPTQFFQTLVSHQKYGKRLTSRGSFSVPNSHLRAGIWLFWRGVQRPTTRSRRSTRLWLRFL